MSHRLTEKELRELVMAFGRLGELIVANPEPDREELRRVRARSRRERRHAPQLFDDLLRVDPKVREEEARSDTRFHSLALVDLLLKRAQAEVLNDPKITRQLAELALVIADAMYPSPRVPHATMRDYFALAHAQIGNVCRLHCQWEEAHARFDKAQGLLLKGAGDLAIHGQIHRMYGALLKDQRQFPAALAFLQLAQDDYRQLGQDHDVGLVLLTTAVLFREMDDSDRALQAHMEACHLLDESRAPMLAAAAWNNLAILLCDLGQYAEAEVVLENLPSTFDDLPQHSTVQLDLMWARGMIARGLGDLTHAIQCFSSVRDGYLTQGNHRSVALVSLDLLRAYYHAGRLAEVENLARSVYSLLRSQPLAREAIEALRVLAGARVQRQLIEESLERLGAFLSRNSIPGQRSPTAEP